MSKREEFERLVRQHHRGLVAVAGMIVGYQDAEEVVQEAWVNAYRAFDRFEGRSEVRTWLYRIVVNEAKSRWRDSADRMPFSLDAEVQDDDDGRFDANGSWKVPPALWDCQTPEAILEQESLAACIEKAIVALPGAQRAVLILRDQEQLEFDDICNILGVSASNARVLLHRARNAIYTMVDEFQEKGTC